MPQTGQNGVKTPINADAYNLTADLATMGASANLVIPVANQTARDALTLAPGLVVCRLDLPTAPIERYDGTAWNGAVVNTYTPTLTASTTNPTLGTGSQQLGNFILNGKMMTAQFFIAFGSSGYAVGSGNYAVSLPPGYTYSGLGSAVPLGPFTAHLPTSLDISGYVSLTTAGATTVGMHWQSASNTQSTVGSGTSSWGTGTYMAGTITIPIA